jgi:ATP-binding cassette subfamily B protein
MVVGGAGISRRMFTCSDVLEELAGDQLAEESVSAVRLIKSYCREHHFQEMFGGASKRYLELNLVMSRLRGLIMPVMALATGAGTLAVLFIGGRLVIAGVISLGDFVAFSGYLHLVWKTVMMGWILTWSRGCFIMERLNAV